MSSLDTMFEASSVHFQHVNERSAHVKIDGVFHVDLGCGISLISLDVGWIYTTGVW